MNRRVLWLWASIGSICALVAWPWASALATGGGNGDGSGGANHIDPFSLVLVELALVTMAAAAGRWLAGTFGKPGVLGELALGVIIGNVGYWLGLPFFEALMHLSEVGEVISTVFATGCSMADAATKVFPAAAMAGGGDRTQAAGYPHGTRGPGDDPVAAVDLVLFESRRDPAAIRRGP